MLMHVLVIAMVMYQATVSEAACAGEVSASAVQGCTDCSYTTASGAFWTVGTLCQ